MSIPDEAVEAAATWLHDIDCRSAVHSGHPADIECYGWTDEARELVNLIAPHMMAAVDSVAGVESLPAGSVVMGFDLDGEQLVSRKSEDGVWEQTGTSDGWQAEGIIREYGTVTVLHRGVPHGNH